MLINYYIKLNINYFFIYFLFKNYFYLKELMINDGEMNDNEINFEINTNSNNKNDLIKFNEEKDYDIIEEKIIDAHSGCCILCVILISLLIILGSVPGIWLYFALVSNHQLWLCMLSVIVTFFLVVIF